MCVGTDHPLNVRAATDVKTMDDNALFPHAFDGDAAPAPDDGVQDAPHAPQTAAPAAPDGDGAQGSEDIACDVAPAPEGDGSDQRAAPRFTLLIRAAKLVAPNGEFVCVIRDVSETGVSVRLFHTLPPGDPLELHMTGGAVYPVVPRWQRGNEAGFEFAEPIDVTRIINEACEYPKRGLRLDVCFPVRLTTLTQSCDALVGNLSQQGARFECDALFKLDQTVRVESIEALPEFGELRAKIRWRRDHAYGVVFDDTFALGDFARLAARLQCPGLLTA